ncbi:MAG: lysylphosphatidylglycerol synthase transmembrane domain-containing protein [Bryobacteraceae bacterium]
MSKISSRAINVAKLLLAAALISWMIGSGKLNLAQVAGAATHWPELLLMAAIVFGQLALTAWRWNVLLEAQGVRLTLREAFSLTMIGVLFNVVIPSSVGGDVIKGYYISRRTGDRTPHALATIFMDRIIGLLGLVVLAAGAALATFGIIRGNRPLELLCLFAIAAAVCGVVGLAAVVVAGGRIPALERRREHRIFGLIAQAAGTLADYRRSPGVLAITMASSILNHALACVVFYLSARALDAPPIAFGYFMLVVPLGMMTTAVPLSPAGVGVGQAAFFTLFQLVPGASAALGASIFTVFQCVQILVYLTGFYFYLSYKHAAAIDVPVRTAT